MQYIDYEEDDEDYLIEFDNVYQNEDDEIFDVIN